MRLGVTCHLHGFWQNDRDLLCAPAVTRGWNGYRNKKVDPGGKTSPASPAGTRTRDLPITSMSFYHPASSVTRTTEPRTHLVSSRILMSS